MLETASTQSLRQTYGVACAINIGRRLGLCRRADIVDCGEMAEMRYFTVQVGNGGLIQAQQGLLQVANNRNQPIIVLAKTLL